MKKTLTLGALAAAALLAVAVPTAVLADSGQGWFGGRGGHHGMMGGRGDGDGEGPRGAMAMRMMERFDTNQDGKITQEEIDATQAERFAAANTDGQPGVTLQEFEPAFWGEHREMMVRAFQRLDRDGDGTVTEEEFAGRTGGLVARMDRNGDGALSADDRGERRGWRWGDDDEDDDRGPMMMGPGQGQGQGQGRGQGQGQGPNAQ